MNKHNAVILAAIASALGLTMTPRSAAAATPASEDNVLATIVVTAQKRETALQDVPFSVAAAGEEQIRNSGVRQHRRPVAQFRRLDHHRSRARPESGRDSRHQRRPGGARSAGREGIGRRVSRRVGDLGGAVHADLDLFDLERFEVLRGPQGTLFGAGSSAGTVRYITRQPKLGEFEGAAEVGGYTGTDADWGGGIKGMINAPMGQTTALRLVGYYNELAGFIDSLLSRPCR